MNETTRLPSPLAGESQGGGKDAAAAFLFPPSPSLPRKGGEGLARRFLRFRRGPWEALATIIIAAGVVMLMQPLALVLYSWSFVTILAGTAMFVIVSHFRD
jgi:hypothetical protein